MACLEINAQLKAELRLNITANLVCDNAIELSAYTFIVRDSRTQEAISNAAVQLIAYNSTGEMGPIYNGITDNTGKCVIKTRALASFTYTIAHPMYYEKSSSLQGSVANIYSNLDYKWDFKLAWYNPDLESLSDAQYLTKDEITTRNITLSFYYIISTKRNLFEVCARKLGPLQPDDDLIFRVPSDFYTADYDNELYIFNFPWGLIQSFIDDNGEYVYVGGYATIISGYGVRGRKYVKKLSNENQVYNFNYGLAFPGIIWVYDAPVLQTDDGLNLSFDGPYPYESYKPNYVLKSWEKFSFTGSTSDCKIYNLEKSWNEIGPGKTITISFDYEYSEVSTGEAYNTRRLGLEAILKGTDNSNIYVDAWLTIPINSTGLSAKGRYKNSFVLNAGINVASGMGKEIKAFIQILSGQASISNVKIELGNVTFTYWSPAESEVAGQLLLENGQSDLYGYFSNMNFPAVDDDTENLDGNFEI